MPPDDVTERAKVWLFRRWLAELGWTEDDWSGLVARGVPVSWAHRLDADSDGAVPASAWPRLIPDPPLQDAPKSRIVGSMHRLEAAAKGIRGARPRNGHPFHAALRAQGRSLESWADEHGISVGTARGWVAPAGSLKARKIPRHWAQRIRAEFGLPATEKTWPTGIR